MDESAALSLELAGAHTWDPVVVNRAPTGRGRQLKVVAFNAQSGRFVSAIADRIKRAPLDGADVILLTEVDWRLRRSERREVAAELASTLRMSFAFFGEFAVQPRQGPPGSFVGSAILSSYPLSDVRAVPLPNFRMRRRMRPLLGAPAGIAARIVVNGRAIALGIVHLNSRWNPAGRDLQVTRYLEEFSQDSAAIIGGDLNTTTVGLHSPASFVKVTALCLMRPGRFRHPQRWEPLFERLRVADFEIEGANVPGAPTFTPSRLIPPLFRPKLDWIAVRGVRPVRGSASVVAARISALSTRFSDHDFVTCQVQV